VAVDHKLLPDLWFRLQLVASRHELHLQTSTGVACQLLPSNSEFIGQAFNLSCTSMTAAGHSMS